MMIFNKVCIVGMGMMGGSLAHALLKNKVTSHVCACTRKQANVDRAIELGLAQSGGTSLSECVSDADCIILCSPMMTYADICQQIAPYLSPSAIVTDIGSTKASAEAIFRQYIPDLSRVVPAHPIRGSEKHGVDNYFEDFFPDSWTIICPLPESSPENVQKVKDLWCAVGSVVEEMDSTLHDKVLGLVSHMPHLLTYGMVGGAKSAEADIMPNASQFYGGGFRSISRLAGSSSTMWHDIFLDNKQGLLGAFDHVEAQFKNLRHLIETDDSEGLMLYLDEAHAYYNHLMETGKDKQ